jgi:predicted GTPase
MRSSKAPGAESSGAASSEAAVRIVLVGQTGAGKSSLINLLTGKSNAKVDVLPSTRSVQPYRLSPGEGNSPILLLDTPGYGQDGATAEQTELIEATLLEADAVLLVMDAHSPARDADVRTLRAIQAHYAALPHFKPPPVIAVLTKIDLLSPVMVWNPPVDWRHGSSAKERSIAEAVAYTRELFGPLVVDVVPVCTHEDNRRNWGVVSHLLPAIAGLLDQARSVSVLAAFEKALSRDRLKHLLRQAATSGRQLVKVWLEERVRRKAPTAGGRGRPTE